MSITTEVRNDLIALVVGVYQAAPGTTLLNTLAGQYIANPSLAATAVFLQNTPEFTAAYPIFLSDTDFATRVVDRILEDRVTTGDRQWAIDTLVADLNAGAGRAELILSAVMELKNTNNPAWANAKAAFVNQVDVAAYHTVIVEKDGTLAERMAVLADVDQTVASADAAKVAQGGPLAAAAAAAAEKAAAEKAAAEKAAAEKAAAEKAAAEKAAADAAAEKAAAEKAAAEKAAADAAAEKAAAEKAAADAAAEKAAAEKAAAEKALADAAAAAEQVLVDAATAAQASASAAVAAATTAVSDAVAAIATAAATDASALAAIAETADNSATAAAATRSTEETSLTTAQDAVTTANTALTAALQANNATAINTAQANLLVAQFNLTNQQPVTAAAIAADVAAAAESLTAANAANAAVTADVEAAEKAAADDGLAATAVTAAQAFVVAAAATANTEDDAAAAALLTQANGLVTSADATAASSSSVEQAAAAASLQAALDAIQDARDANIAIDTASASVNTAAAAETAALAAEQAAIDAGVTLASDQSLLIIAVADNIAAQTTAATPRNPALAASNAANANYDAALSGGNADTIALALAAKNAAAADLVTTEATYQSTLATLTAELTSLGVQLTAKEAEIDTNSTLQTTTALAASDATAALATATAESAADILAARAAAQAAYEVAVSAVGTAQTDAAAFVTAASLTTTVADDAPASQAQVDANALTNSLLAEITALPITRYEIAMIAGLDSPNYAAINAALIKYGVTTITISDTNANASDLNAVDTGLTAATLNAGSVTDLTGTYADVTAAYASTGIIGLGDASVALSDPVTVSNANAIAEATSGVITATLLPDTDVNLKTLTGTGNAYTITLAAGVATAANLNSIDAATTVTVDATAVTDISGTVTDVKTVLASDGITTSGTFTSVLTGTVSVADANIVDAATTGVVTARIEAGSASELAALTGTGNDYQITVTGTTAAASDLSAILAATIAQTIDATDDDLKTLTGSAEQAILVIPDQRILGGLANATVILTDTTLAADRLTHLDGLTLNGVIDASSLQTLTGTAAQVLGAYTANTPQTVSGLGDEDVVLSGTVSVADANSVVTATTGVITATIATDTAANLAALTGTGNAYTVNVTGAADASDLILIDATTTVTVNATAVTSIDGAVADVKTAIAADGISNSGAFASTLTDATVSVADANTVDAATTGVVTAKIATGKASDLLALTGTGNAYTLTLSAGTEAAADLISLDAKTTVAVVATAVTTLTGTASDVITVLNANPGITTGGTQGVTLSDTSLAALTLTGLDSLTSGVVDAASVSTLTGTADDVTDAYTANTSKTISGLGNEAVSLSNTTISIADLDAVDALTTGTVTVAGILDTAENISAAGNTSIARGTTVVISDSTTLADGTVVGSTVATASAANTLAAFSKAVTFSVVADIADVYTNLSNAAKSEATTIYASDTAAHIATALTTGDLQINTIKNVVDIIIESTDADILLTQSQFSNFIAGSSTVIDSGQIRVIGNNAAYEQINLGTLRNIGADTLIIGDTTAVADTPAVFPSATWTSLDPLVFNDTFEFDFNGVRYTATFADGPFQLMIDTAVDSSNKALGFEKVVATFTLGATHGISLSAVDTNDTFGTDLTIPNQSTTYITTPVTGSPVVDGVPGVGAGDDKVTVNLGSSGVTTVVINGTANHDVTAADGLIETFVISSENNGGINLRNLEIGDQVVIGSYDGSAITAAGNYRNLDQRATIFEVDGEEGTDNNVTEWHFADGVLTYFDGTNAVSINLVGVTNVTSDNAGTFIVGAIG